jgi:uncharacterized membrane protein YecN with MAPEG domain
MGPMVGVIIVFIIFVSITGLILGVIYLRNRNQERMKILEKGADPSVLKSEIRRGGNVSLKIGIFFIAIALGIIIGSLIANYTYIFPESAVAYFSSIFLFGGLSLLIVQFIGNKNNK